MSKLFGGMAAFLVVLGALPAWAIDIVIAPGATARVESTNVISVSPVNVGANPFVAPGNYTVQFQWDPLENVLVPISAVPAALGNVGREINGVVIETESLIPSFPGAYPNYPNSQFCWLQVRLHNRATSPRNFRLYFNAFDSAGRSIGYTVVGGYTISVYPNNTTVDQDAWLPFGWTGYYPHLTCDQIARYELDLFRSYALPPS